MSSEHSDEIAQLLRQGLDHYGNDEVGAAVACWERVLALEPDNADAADYVESAGNTPSVGAEPVQASFELTELSLLEETVALAAGGQVEEAYILLDGATAGADIDLETATVLELLRARLLPLYREIFDDRAKPQLAQDPATVEQFNLPPAAGFMVSLCDGETEIQDLVSVSGMDSFEALRNLKGLHEAGLLRMAS